MFNKEKNNKLSKFGKVIEEEDKIIVYVKQGIVYKCNNKVLQCEKIEGKKVYYVFENIDFADRTCINGSNCYLIFNSCTFTQSFKVDNANNILMENNKYAFYSYANNFIDLTANEIVIKDNNFTNTSFAKKYDEPKVDITLIGNIINIDNSVVCSEYSGYINIISNDLNVSESTINGQEIYISADNITTKKSIMYASKSIKIDNSSCNFTCIVKSPVTIYNDIKLNSKESQIIEIDEEKAKLIKARIELINALHKIEMDCIRKNSDELSEIQKRLKLRKISRVFK